MLATIALFGALSLFAQDSSKEIQAWIQKLRADRIEEREQATQELKKLGTAALTELEKVAADKDDEVAARARILLRTIRLKDMLGIELKDLDNLPASKVVEWMEKKSGRKFLFATSIGLENVRIRVKPELIDLADPYAVGVDLLRLAYLGVAPSDSVPGAVEVFQAPLGGKMALKTYKSIDELPRANEFCTLVLHPRHVSPRTVQAVLINLVSFPQNCLSVEDSGTLVLSDYASVLRKCAEIVKEVDVLRSFRVSIAILEGRSAKEASVPEPFGNLRAGDHGL